MKVTATLLVAVLGASAINVPALQQNPRFKNPIFSAPNFRPRTTGPQVRPQFSPNMIPRFGPKVLGPKGGPALPLYAPKIFGPNSGFPGGRPAVPGQVPNLVPFLQGPITKIPFGLPPKISPKAGPFLAPHSSTLCGKFFGSCDTGLFCNFPHKCGNSFAPGLCLRKPARCPDINIPVCGCDGNDYTNPCTAAQVPVSIAKTGRCDGTPVKLGPFTLPPIVQLPPIIPKVAGGPVDIPSIRPNIPAIIPKVRPQCTSDSDCSSIGFIKMFCAKDTCNADGGKCRLKSPFCRRSGQEVCGCDGMNYGSKCKAYKAGMSVDYDGQCKTPVAVPEAPQLCGGKAGQVCGPTTTCVIKPGQCQVSDALGYCWNLNAAHNCSNEPVCGCNGKVYATDCLAHEAGVQVDYAGICRAPVPVAPSPEFIIAPVPADNVTCGANSECDATQFCNQNFNCGGYGTCTIRPSAGGCARGGQPVCGCDGMTYRNACAANAHGTGVAGEGACGRLPETPPSLGQCFADEDCNVGTFCDLDEAVCGYSSLPGSCIPIPDATSCAAFVNSTICSCNFKEFGNACYAHARGESVQNLGKCEVTGGGSIEEHRAEATAQLASLKGRMAAILEIAAIEAAQEAEAQAQTA